MVGGIRDVALFRDWRLLAVFGAIFLSALVCNVILTAATGTAYFTPGLAGAAFAHNFGLTSSGEGPTANGKIAVAVGIAVVLAITCCNTFGRKKGGQR